MVLSARRQHGKRARLLPRKKESLLPSSEPSHKAEGLAEAPAQVVPGEDVAEALYRAVTAARRRGEEVLLACPTIKAHRAEQRLLEALEHGTAEEVLPSLLEEYLATHRMPQGEPWTGDEVPLYYVTVKRDGSTVTAYTANGLQVRIITELWRRRASDAAFTLVTL